MLFKFQVLCSDSEWFEPPVDDDTVILIAGEVLELWLNGEIKAIVSGNLMYAVLSGKCAYSIGY